MQYRSVKGFTGFAQLGILFVFLALGFLLAGGAQFIIGMRIIPTGTSLPEMGDAMLKAMIDPHNVGMARLAQVLGTFFLLFIPAILYSWVTNGKNKFWLGFNKYVNGYQLLIGFVIIFAANIFAAPLADISKAVVVYFPSLDVVAKKLEIAYNEQVLALSNLRSWPEFIIAIFIMAFFPAMFEEVFFRGALQNLLEKWWKNPFMAILITSLLFSFIHLSIYLFLSRAVLGFVLGLMYHKTKNIWVNIIAHFLNNAIAIAQLFYMSRQNQKLDISKIDPKVDWWYGVIALLALIFLFRLLERYSKQNRLNIDAKEQLLLSKHTPDNPFAQTENI